MGVSIKDPNRRDLKFLNGDKKKMINELNTRGNEFGDKLGKKIKHSMDEVRKQE